MLASCKIFNSICFDKSWLSISFGILYVSLKHCQHCTMTRTAKTGFNILFSLTPSLEMTGDMKYYYSLKPHKPIKGKLIELLLLAASRPSNN